MLKIIKKLIFKGLVESLSIVIESFLETYLLIYNIQIPYLICIFIGELLKRTISHYLKILFNKFSKRRKHY